MERASDFITRIARMNKLGDRIEGEPYQPDGCADDDAQALYRLIAEAREMAAQDDDPIDAAFRAAAQRDSRLSEGSLEVDDTAIVSRGSDPGAYVQAWIWVTNLDAGFDSAEGSEELSAE